MKVKIRSLISFDSIFLLIIFLVGIITTFSYGVYWDQSIEQSILFSNIKEYAMQLGLTDLEWINELNKEGIPRISESIEKDHGIAMYYPATIVWYINQISPYAGNVFWHMYTFILVFMGMCFLYLLSIDLFSNRKISVVVTLLFFMTPRMFASAHYNNKDMILVSLLFAMFYWGKRLIQETTWKNIIMFAIFGAFAFNVKIIGACFFGAIGIYALLTLIITKRINKSVLIRCGVCIATWFGVFLLITPATWWNLISYFKYVMGFTLNFSRWSNYILYNGKLLHSENTGIPNNYLITMMVYTIPVVIQVLVVVGGVVLIYDLIKKRKCISWEKEGYVALIMLLGLGPIIFATISATLIYNGWRHFYFAYCSIIMLCGYGIFRLNQLCYGKILNRVKKIVCVGYLLISALFLMLNYPFADSYYNFLAGKNVELRYEMDYWNVSMKQAYETILEDASKKKISVSGINSRTNHGLETNLNSLLKNDKKRIKLLPAEEWLEADYVVVNVTYAIIHSEKEYELLKEEYSKVQRLTCYNNTIAEVYKKNKKAER